MGSKRDRSPCNSVSDLDTDEACNCEYRLKKNQVVLAIFKDNCMTVGGKVKAQRHVLKEHERRSSRSPNLMCRIESFTRICQTFDERTTKWVKEMGFGGLLDLPSDLQLPRKLSYWLLSRVDPISRKLIGTDGKEFKFSKHQVHWVFGIPNGGLPVPTKKSLNIETRVKTYEILGKYGKTWEGKSKTFRGRTYTSTGIFINSSMLERLEGYWEAHDKEEFKTLLLLIVLQMLLCPTQSPRLACDLVPALTCASYSENFDWCELVLGRLMQSVLNFARGFYESGFAKGCGGCTMFLVIFYLDRLNRDPVCWGILPRIKVWNTQHIRAAAKEDKITATGDFGNLGMLDVAYGEQHPVMARDSNGPVDTAQVVEEFGSSRRATTSKKRRKGRNDSKPFVRNDSSAMMKLLYPLSCNNGVNLQFCRPSVSPLLPVCEVTIFLNNSKPQWAFPLQFTTFNRKTPSSHCSALFISLQRCQIIVLQSGMPSLSWTAINNLLGELRGMLNVGVLGYFSTKLGWSVKILNNNPVLKTH